MRKLLMIISKAMEVISTSIKSFLFTVVLSVLGILLMTVTIYFNEKYWNFEKEADRALKSGIDGTYTIGTGETKFDEAQIFVEIIKENPDMIEGIGSIEYTRNAPDIKELREIRNANLSVEEPLEACFASTYSLGLADIKLEEGRMIEKGEEIDCTYGIYLGSSFKDIPIGTEYVFVKKSGYKAKVLGRMAEGTVIPNTGVIGGIGLSMNGTPCVNMDYGIVWVRCELNMSYPMLLSLGEGYTLDELMTQVNLKSEKYGCVVDVAPLSNAFDEYNYYNEGLIRTLRKLMFVVLFAVIMIIISMQIVAILKNRRIYGVYVVSGMSNYNIRCITIIENILRMILTLLISYSVMVMYWSVIGPAISETIFDREIVMRYVFWKVALIELGVTVVSTMVPLAVLGRYTPVRLIEEIK